MLRFIFKNHYVNLDVDANQESYFTLDVDMPEIEKVLLYGGQGGSGFNVNQLVGIEVLKNQEADNEK